MNQGYRPRQLIYHLILLSYFWFLYFNNLLIRFSFSMLKKTVSIHFPFVFQIFFDKLTKKKKEAEGRMRKMLVYEPVEKIGRCQTNQSLWLNEGLEGKKIKKKKTKNLLMLFDATTLFSIHYERCNHKIHNEFLRILR